METIGITSFLVSLCIFVFACYKSGGFIEWLKNNDTMFFVGLGTVIFSGLFLVLSFSNDPRDVPLTIAYFITVPFSLLLLFSVMRCAEGEGIIIDNNYQPGYPITLTQKSKAVVIEVSKAKQGLLFFTRNVPLAAEAEGNKVAVLFKQPEQFNIGDQVEFRVFSGSSPVISGFPFLEARSTFSFIKKLKPALLSVAVPATL